MLKPKKILKKSLLLFFAVLLLAEPFQRASAATINLVTDPAEYEAIGDIVDINATVTGASCISSNVNYKLRYNLAIDSVSKQKGISAQFALPPFVTTANKHIISVYFWCGTEIGDATPEQRVGDVLTATKEIKLKSSITPPPPPSSATTCPKGTGQIPQNGKCACPAGLEKVDPTKDDSKCKISNPAEGILIDIPSFDKLLERFIEILLYFAGAIAVVFLVIGGFRYVTSAGNEELMEKAKKNITSAVIGIIIIVMAFAIVSIVNTLLTRDKTGQTSTTTPPGSPEPPPPPGDTAGEIQVSGKQTVYEETDLIDITFTAPTVANYTWGFTSTLSGLTLAESSNGASAKLTGRLRAGDGGKKYSVTVTAIKDSKTLSKTVELDVREPGTSSP